MGLEIKVILNVFATPMVVNCNVHDVINQVPILSWIVINIWKP